ncbi:protein kinase domain-containing protein [Toxoplasma gondii GAB2-2007-GAL-DOM2]|uniref:Protein kinase domain-containing protein n=4 Tax=Toxoplasma gondii TaxID=5811 RepID=S7WJK0_TOXGG|nr:protein kinase domain-containing protein [Toxoplasma gondii GT1]KFG43201.1 protein kinase domain-containing protein [Toxoplasma gondii GAB2-2007-GAL-DOM2]KFG50287.1 protein kinase domain-containing protein [Toxoplasma gondii FOU]
MKNGDGGDFRTRFSPQTAFQTGAVGQRGRGKRKRGQSCESADEEARRDARRERKTQGSEKRAGLALLTSSRCTTDPWRKGATGTSEARQQEATCAEPEDEEGRLLRLAWASLRSLRDGGRVDPSCHTCRGIRRQPIGETGRREEDQTPDDSGDRPSSSHAGTSRLFCCPGFCLPKAFATSSLQNGKKKREEEHGQENRLLKRQCRCAVSLRFSPGAASPQVKPNAGDDYMCFRSYFSPHLLSLCSVSSAPPLQSVRRSTREPAIAVGTASESPRGDCSFSRSLRWRGQHAVKDATFSRSAHLGSPAGSPLLSILASPIVPRRAFSDELSPAFSYDRDAEALVPSPPIFSTMACFGAAPCDGLDETADVRPRPASGSSLRRECPDTSRPPTASPRRGFPATSPSTRFCPVQRLRESPSTSWFGRRLQSRGPSRDARLSSEKLSFSPAASPVSPVSHPASSPAVGNPSGVCSPLQPSPRLPPAAASGAVSPEEGQRTDVDLRNRVPSTSDECKMSQKHDRPWPGVSSSDSPHPSSSFAPSSSSSSASSSALAGFCQAPASGVHPLRQARTRDLPHTSSKSPRRASPDLSRQRRLAQHRTASSSQTASRSVSPPSCPSLCSSPSSISPSSESPSCASPASALLREERRALEKAALRCCLPLSHRRSDQVAGIGETREERSEQAEADGVLKALKHLLRLLFFRHTVLKHRDAGLVPAGPRTPSGILAAVHHVADSLQLRALKPAQEDVRTALRLLLVIHRLSLQLPTEVLNAPQSPLERLPLLLLQRLNECREQPEKPGKGGRRKERRRRGSVESGCRDSPVNSSRLRLVAGYAGWLEQKLFVVRDLDIFFSGNWSLESFLKANRLESLSALAAAAGDEDAGVEVHISPVSVDILERLLRSVLLPALTLCRGFIGQAETPVFPVCAALLCHLADDVWGAFSVCLHLYSLLLSRVEGCRTRRRRPPAPAPQSLGGDGEDPQRLTHAGEKARQSSATSTQLSRRLASLRPGLVEAVRRVKEVADWCDALSSHVDLLSRLRQPTACLLSVLGDLLHVPPSSFSFSSCLRVGIHPSGSNSFLILRNDHARLLAHLPLPAPSLEHLAEAPPWRQRRPSASSPALACLSFSCSSCSSSSCFDSWSAFLGGDTFFQFYSLAAVPTPGDHRGGLRPRSGVSGVRARGPTNQEQEGLSPSRSSSPCFPPSGMSPPTHAGSSGESRRTREYRNDGRERLSPNADVSHGRESEHRERSCHQGDNLSRELRVPPASLASRPRASSCRTERTGKGSSASEPGIDATGSEWVHPEGSRIPSEGKEYEGKDLHANLYRLAPPEYDEEQQRRKHRSASRGRRESGSSTVRNSKPRDAGFSFLGSEAKTTRDEGRMHPNINVHNQPRRPPQQELFPGTRTQKKDEALTPLDGASGGVAASFGAPSGSKQATLVGENPFSPESADNFFPSAEPFFPSSAEAVPYSVFAKVGVTRSVSRDDREETLSGDCKSPRPHQGPWGASAPDQTERQTETVDTLPNWPEDVVLRGRDRVGQSQEKHFFSGSGKQRSVDELSEEQEEGAPSAAVASFEEILLSFTKKGQRRDGSRDPDSSFRDCSTPPATSSRRRQNGALPGPPMWQGDFVRQRENSESRVHHGVSRTSSMSGKRGTHRRGPDDTSTSHDWRDSGDVRQNETVASRGLVKREASNSPYPFPGIPPPPFFPEPPAEDRWDRSGSDLLRGSRAFSPDLWERQDSSCLPRSNPHEIGGERRTPSQRSGRVAHSFAHDPSPETPLFQPASSDLSAPPAYEERGAGLETKGRDLASQPHHGYDEAGPLSASQFSSRGASGGNPERRVSGNTWPREGTVGGPSVSDPARGYPPSSPSPAGFALPQGPSPCFDNLPHRSLTQQPFPVGPFQTPAPVPCPPAYQVSVPQSCSMALGGYLHACRPRNDGEDSFYLHAYGGLAPQGQQPSELGFASPAWSPFVPSPPAGHEPNIHYPSPTQGPAFAPGWPGVLPLDPPLSPRLTGPTNLFPASPAYVPPFGFFADQGSQHALPGRGDPPGQPAPLSAGFWVNGETLRNLPRRREASEPPGGLQNCVGAGSGFSQDPFSPEGDSADWSIPQRELVVEEKIGSGASSEVFAGTWRGSEVAIKRVVLPENELAFHAIRDFQRELKIMLRLRHPNLVLLMGANLHSRPLFVVTELCAGGSLFDLLHGARVVHRGSSRRASLSRPRCPSLWTQRGRESSPVWTREGARARDRSLHGGHCADTKREASAKAKEQSGRVFSGMGGRKRRGVDKSRNANEAERHQDLGSGSDFTERRSRASFSAGSDEDASQDEGNRVVLTWWQKAKIAFDVAKGCAYLHGSRPPIIHRDLKSLNILLTEKIVHRQQIPHAKVADFGLSRITTVAESGHRPPGYAATSDPDPRSSFVADPSLLPRSSPFLGHNMAGTNRTGIVGTYYWMAPEVIAAGKYSEKIDVYSFGVVLYELLSESLPYARPVEEAFRRKTDPRGRSLLEPGERQNRQCYRAKVQEKDPGPRRESSCSQFSSRHVSTPGDRSNPDCSGTSSEGSRSSRSSDTFSSEASVSPHSPRSRENEEQKKDHVLVRRDMADILRGEPERQRITMAPLSPSEVCRNVVRGERPDLTRIPADCPPSLLELMKACWHQSPARRPSFQTITQILREFLQTQNGAVPRG